MKCKWIAILSFEFPLANVLLLLLEPIV